MKKILLVSLMILCLYSCGSTRKVKTYEVTTIDGKTDTIKAYTTRYAHLNPDSKQTDCILFIDTDNATIGYYPLSKVKSFKTIE